MADQIPNGTGTNGVDVEMKEETPREVRLINDDDLIYWTNGTEAPMHAIQQADPTDPNPPPQAQLQMLQPQIQPLPVPTPPAVSGASARPGSMPPQPSARPEKPVAHGGPTRQFLNQNITPHLLEGVKYLAVYEPEKPLLWLADFLRDRSKEIEG